MKLGNTSAHQSAGCILALIAFAFALPMGANAQWEVIYLNPPGATSSRAFGIGDAQQAGSAMVGGVAHAGLWSGSAKSWVDLHPAGMARSHADGVGGGQQVGYVFDDVGVPHASLWTGTAHSWVGLHPAGADLSVALDVGGGQQVGYAEVRGSFHAGLWNGTAASWVDLHPAGATESRALDVDGGQQVGNATVDVGVIHAGLWTGTAVSWVDLHPAGATLSNATGVGGGQQVGYAKVGGRFHAGLWNGTAASWVDLHPPGANESSEALAVDGGQQVGFVFHNDPYRASLWNGTAESCVDLHAFLPKKFESSVASGIWHDATHTYVVGYGYNSKRQRQEALMWRAETGEGPAPLEITTISLPDAVVDELYSATLEATGGTTPYTWAILNGNLPDGLGLDAQTGVISGTPTTEETETFTVGVLDSSQEPQEDTAELSITVGTAPAVDVTILSVVARGIREGGKYNITAKIRNDSPAQVTIHVDCLVDGEGDGELLPAREVTIAAGETATVKFNDVSQVVAGDYTAIVAVEEDPDVGENDLDTFRVK